MPPALLWGMGTAIGEIPPYAFSYHAAKAGIRNEEWDNMFEVTPVSEGQGLLEALVNRMKNWMLRFIQKCAHPCPLHGKKHPAPALLCLCSNAALVVVMTSSIVPLVRCIVYACICTDIGQLVICGQRPLEVH